MIEFVGDMLRSPEAQVDAYGWAAVLLAHFALGLIGTVLLCLPFRPWTAARVVIGLYLVGWEGLQLALYGSAWADSAVDGAAVAFGAIVGAALWLHAIGPLVVALALLVVLGADGVRRRR